MRIEFFLIFLLIFFVITISGNEQRRNSQRGNRPRQNRYHQETRRETEETKAPIFIFPGLLSNSLYHTPDSKRSCFEEMRLWYTLRSNMYDWCWIETMKLSYDRNTNSVHDSQTNISLGQRFGDTESMEDIGEGDYFGLGSLFKDFVKVLEQKGYQKRKDLFGVPMDWRRSVTDFPPDYYITVNELLKTAVANAKKPAIIICHSYGCLNLARFIEFINPERFTDKFGKILLLGAPWKGSTKALQTLISGDTLGLGYPIHPSLLAPLTRTFTSLVHLIPGPEIRERFGPIVQHNNKNFTDMRKALKEFGIDPKMIDSREDISNMINIFDRLDAKIKIYCRFGIGKKVVSNLRYNTLGLWPSKKYLDNGDGTVGYISLAACTQHQPRFNVTSYSGLEHKAMLTDSRILKLISELAD